MKVYGTGIYENDRADLVGLAYLHFSISQIEDVIEWMKGLLLTLVQYCFY